MASYSRVGFLTHRGLTGNLPTTEHWPYSPQECPPPCPACGGLQCLCRPRFFPGQLLTDEDLNRLEHYVVEKNKLHNRYLHGQGIVCGLDVVCNPCDSKGVIVKTGYALSPCGDDIVVCKDSPVNVCDLINQCRPVKEVECDPMHPAPTETCPEGEQEWVLAICYDEKQSRGITALRADVMSPCCSTCACGGSSACGCGCHGASSATRPNGTRAQHTSMGVSKKRPAECEPTLTCETYRFMVYRYQEKKAESGADDDFKRKIAYVSTRLPQPPSDTAALAAWANYGNVYRDVVLGFLSETLCVSDEDKRKLAAMAAPDVTLLAHDRAGYIGATKNYVGNVTVYLIYYLLLLLCQNLKPSCGGPVERNCVPLARVRVGKPDKPDCRVVSICEVSVREYVLTALLEHFYAPLRFWLPSVLGKLCCDWVRRLPADIWGKRIGDKIVAFDDAARVSVLNTLEGRGAKPLEARALLDGVFAAPEREIDMETLALALLGAKGAAGNLFARPEELANPSAFLLASQVLRPMLQAALPESWTSALQLVSKLGATDISTLTQEISPTGVSKELTDLRKTVANLQKTASDQQKTITNLERRIRRR